MPLISGSGGGLTAPVGFSNLAITPRAAQGTSSSGTAGTTVIDLNISTGTKLVAWNLWAAQSNAASTQLTVTITYTDNSTTVMTTSAATDQQILANAGDGIRLQSGVFNATVGLNIAKDVKRIQVQTAGTGTGQRSAGASALEV